MRLYGHVDSYVGDIIKYALFISLLTDDIAVELVIVFVYLV